MAIGKEKNMKNTIKTLVLMMALVLALTAFTGCELFEKECTHEGTTELIPSVIPTCTETGMSLGTKCTKCGEIVLAPEVTPARGHDKTTLLNTTADCVTAGVETWNCGFCGENYDVEVEAYGHDLVDVEGKAATCTEDGYTAHQKCEACGHVEGKEVIAAGHAWGEADENGTVVCGACSRMEVSTYEGLVAAINADENFVLANDIVLPDSFATLCAGTRSGSSYTGEAFSGVLDGNNFTISNVTSTLIGVLDGGTVKNLKIEASIDTTGDSVGAVAGIMVDGLIENVTVEGSVTSDESVGGIVGRILAQGTVKNCVNNAAITSTGSGDAAGGIVGKAYYTAEGKEINILGCENTGAITSGYAAGGIAGFSAANIIDCSNSGEINGVNATGGIVGEQTTYGEVSGNTSTANVTSSSGNAGGIIGWIRYQNNASAYPVSEIIVVSGNTAEGNISGGYNAGGIVGLAYNQAIVTGNTYSGTSVTGATFAAGVVGGLQVDVNNLDIEAEYRFVVSENTVSFETVTANCTDDFAYNNVSSEAKIENNTKS